VIAAKDDIVRSPINKTRDATFLHIKVDQVYVMAATKGNPNCSLVFEFLNSLVVTFVDFFGDFTEEAIRKNSAVIYELLDECWIMDILKSLKQKLSSSTSRVQEKRAKWSTKI